jgi:putative membrane protein
MDRSESAALEEQVFAIQRPHQNLWTLYIIRAILALPLAPVLLPYFWFRYHTLRYSFDREGVSMRWGILFRREINLTYSRIQDIHLSSGFIQRWLQLADVQVQTASGSAAAEMTIEGLLEHEKVRDYLYQRMRGLREPHARATSGAVDAPAAGDGADAILREILGEVRATRHAIERGAR